MTILRLTRPRTGLRFALVLGAATAFALAAHGHEGHQHADEPAPAVRAGVAVGVPRSATSDLHELLVRAEAAAPGDPAHVHLLLADATTNEPIAGAAIEVVPAGADSAWDAVAIAPGIYEAHVPDPVRGLEVLVRRGDTLDLITVDSLTSAEAAAVAAAGATAGARSALLGWPVGAGIVAALAAAGLAIALLRRRAARRAAVLLLVVGMGLGALGSSVARGHEGELHGDEKEASSGGKTGDRMSGAGQVPPGARYVAKESQFEIGLRTALVRAESLAPTRSAFGTVVADPAASATVVAPQTGRFVSGRAWRPGDRVRRGQALGSVLVVDELPVRAPLGGTIASIDVVPGQTVAAGQTLATIVNLARVRIDLPLYGEALTSGLAARTARVQLAALPGKTFAARIEGLAPATTGAGTGAPLVLSASNPEGLLRPGMIVEVTLELPGAVDALTVPAAAVVGTEQGPAVFVKTGPEAFALRAVTLGARAGDRVAIARGVADGEKVVISGLAPLLATSEAPR